MQCSKHSPRTAGLRGMGPRACQNWPTPRRRESDMSIKSDKWIRRMAESTA